MFIHFIPFLQSKNRYVNYVVVQQNPVIMQESDTTIKVECAFEASEQTVSYVPVGGGGRREGSDNLGAGSLDVTSVPNLSDALTAESTFIRIRRGLITGRLSANWDTTW